MVYGVPFRNVWGTKRSQLFKRRKTLAKITTEAKSGYTLNVAVGRRKGYVLPQVVSEMLLFLLKRAHMQPDAYTFHLTNLGRFVKATSKLYMHLGAYSGQGWTMSVCFDRAEKDTARGNLLLPEGMSKEAYTVRLRKVLDQLNEDGWKDFLTSVKKEKELANKSTLKIPKGKPVAIFPILLSNESARVVSPVGTVRKSRITKLLLDVNFTIDLARVLEIQVRSREIEVRVQQFQAELDAYGQHGKGPDRIPAIQQCLQQLAIEVETLLTESESLESKLKATPKAKIIEALVGMLKRKK